MMEHKSSLVTEFSNGRTSSSKELSVDEARVLITHLSDLERQSKGVSHSPRQPMEVRSPQGFQSVKDKRRRKVFALMYQIGYIYGDTLEDKKINSAVVNRIVSTYGVCKPKALNDYTEEELISLINQFEKWKSNNEMAAISKAVRAEVKEVLGL